MLPVVLVSFSFFFRSISFETSIYFCPVIEEYVYCVMLNLVF